MQPLGLCRKVMPSSPILREPPTLPPLVGSALFWGRSAPLAHWEAEPDSRARSGKGSFQQFVQELDRIADDPPALQYFFTAVKGAHLVAVLPIHPGNFPALDASVILHDFGPKSPHHFLIIGPHPRVFLFLFAAPAKPQAQNPQGPNQSPTGLAVSAEAAAEGSHGPDHLLILFSQDFLPDRKNGLASMKPLHHHLHRFFPHFLPSHGPLRFRVSVSVRKEQFKTLMIS